MLERLDVISEVASLGAISNTAAESTWVDKLKKDPGQMDIQKKPELTTLLDGTGDNENKHESTACGIKDVVDVISAWTSNFSLVSQYMNALIK